MSFLRNQFTRTPFDDENEKKKDDEEKKMKRDLQEMADVINLLKDERLKGIKSTKNKNEITISIQLLIMDYLGFLQIGNLTNANKAVLLGVIFGTDGTENIRKSLSNVGGNKSPLKERKNLLYIEELFKRLGLEEPLKKV